MRIAHAPSQLDRRPRAVAIGTFDGVHRGHRSVSRATLESGLEPTVITLDPHPRIVLGNRVELLTTLERRLELLSEAGIADTLVAAFTPEFMRLDPEEFVETYLRAIGAEAVAVGQDFRFGSKRAGERGDASRARARGARRWRSSRVSRRRRSGTPCGAGTSPRPPPCSAVPSSSTGRSSPATSGEARSAIRRRTSHGCAAVCPRYGIYAGEALGHRAAVSIGTNPHYGGTERRIEPFLLDFDGDLYGSRLVVELWERLRDEAVFDSEEALIGQIAKDVEATRAAVPGSGRA